MSSPLSESYLNNYCFSEMDENVLNRKTPTTTAIRGKLGLGKYAPKFVPVVPQLQTIRENKPAVPIIATKVKNEAVNRITRSSSSTSVSSVSTTKSNKPSRDAFSDGIEDKSLYQWRANDFRGAQEAKEQQRLRKRQSMALRTRIAFSQREAMAEMQRKKFEEEKSLFESSRMDREAQLEYKASLKKRARESLAWRADNWRHHRSIEERDRQEAADKRAEYAEWQRQDWAAHEEYKKTLLRENKRHLAGLLDKWRTGKQAIYEDESKQREVDALEAALLKQESEWRRQERDQLAQQAQELRQRQHSEAERKAMLHHVREAEKRILARPVESPEARQQRRSSNRKSLATAMVEEQQSELRALEQHQATLQSLNSEFQRTLLSSVVLEEARSCVEAAQARGRVSLMMRLESWRQVRLEEEVEEALQEEETEEALQNQWEDIQHAKELLVEEDEECDDDTEVGGEEEGTEAAFEDEEEVDDEGTEAAAEEDKEELAPMDESLAVEFGDAEEVDEFPPMDESLAAAVEGTATPAEEEAGDYCNGEDIPEEEGGLVEEY